MAHPVVHESKHIAKRVLIGVTTSVLGAAIVYFLYNRGPDKPSDVEVKKNTITAWHKYVDMENELGTSSDSNLAKVNRALISDAAQYEKQKQAIASFCTEDSSLLHGFHN